MTSSPILTIHPDGDIRNQLGIAIHIILRYDHDAGDALCYRSVL